MMKRVLLIVLAFALITYGSYAQVPRNTPSVLVEQNNTNFHRIGLVGLDKVGNPGYIALSAASSNEDISGVTYYLWVDISGTLLISSFVTLESGARATSFPDGDWRTFNSEIPGIETVGKQL